MSARYLIVERWPQPALVDAVEHYLAEGWTLVGGVTVRYNQSGWPDAYLQAMLYDPVRYVYDPDAAHPLQVLSSPLQPMRPA